MKHSWSPLTVFAAIIISLGIIVNGVSAGSIDQPHLVKAHRSMTKIASRSPEAKRQALWLRPDAYEEDAKRQIVPVAQEGGQDDGDTFTGEKRQVAQKGGQDNGSTISG
ncbi:hypothetical protein C8R44DRAFT_893235 [Mycena epipterygia]|nr:hypothetical protein C8R44DRAFT_893235 [Mycena epipterygia]